VIDERAAILDRDTFEALVTRHQPELQLHCYRMLGSVHDAEDASQETLLRAWRGREGYEGRAAARTWLYRIATNVCLRALERRRAVRRRVLPESLAGPCGVEPLGAPATEVGWLEPYPTPPLERLHDPEAGPEDRAELREAVGLAFVAAIQWLPARQRAALLLLDVLGMSASEAAAALGTSVAATNSAVQRARATLRGRDPGGRHPFAPATTSATDDNVRRLLDRYVRAWEAADVDRFVGLLADDASWSMPPWREWYRGAHDIGAFVAWAWRRGPGRERLVPTVANGQPAFGHYRRSDEHGWVPFAIQVLGLDERAGVVSITSFVSGDLFGAFGLPPVPPDR
jgi:RNA polymerase sigma-70 factor, ECF subfamily